MAEAERGRARSDRELLQDFLAESDQAAFTALVQRHGPLVLGVCRRVLHDAHDAEDAFQATFLLLTQKAASIRRREALASWLHGVAYRMAQNARRAAERRRRHEGRAGTGGESDPAGEVAWREVQAILDEEVSRLAAPYRDPFILCFLDGRTRAEAAAELGLKLRTLESRLARAREQLRRRLEARGVSLTALLPAMAIATSGALAAIVPAKIIASTVEAASVLAAGGATSPGVAALLKGASNTMFVSKVKVVMVCVLSLAALVAGLGGGVRMLAYNERAAEPPAKEHPGAEASTNDAFVGDWTNVDEQTGGITRIVIAKKGDAWTVQAWGRSGDERFVDQGITTLHLLLDRGAKEPGAVCGFASWDHKFAERHRTLRVSGRVLVVEEYTIFKDRSNRPSYRSRYEFRKKAVESAPPEPKTERPENVQPTGDEVADSKELKRLQGSWVAVPGGEYKGEKLSAASIRSAGHVLLISGDKLTWRTSAGVALVGKIAVNPARQPKEFDLTFSRDGQPATGLCIYELKGDTFTFVYGESKRPTQFKTSGDTEYKLYVFRHEAE
jgi:RNA polymerase sigma factor (sigma-70 family)